MMILPQITLKELEIVTFLYSRFFKYDESYANLSSKTLNLSVQNDLDCIIQFLRNWGCRQFKKEDHKLSSNSLKSWYHNFERELPSTNKGLLELSNRKIKSFEHLFNELQNSPASEKKGKSRKIYITVGSVGAAKTLFALRKHTFAP